MMSEAEQRRLTEIEAQLRADDPTFAQRFDDHKQRRSRPRWHSVAAMLAIALAVAAVVVGLTVGSVGLVVVVALTVIGASAGSWITNRSRP